MNARERITYWRNVANEGRSSSMTTALHEACDELEKHLALAAAAEESQDEVVRELGEWSRIYGDGKGNTLPSVVARAAARIVSDEREKERLRAELAGVRAVVEIAEKFGKPGGDFAATLIITELLEAVAAHRAAHPKDAP